MFVLNYLFANKPAACLDAADVNDNGEINIADPIYLLNHIFSDGPKPPEPYPKAGIDLTLDEFGC